MKCFDDIRDDEKEKVQATKIFLDIDKEEAFNYTTGKGLYSQRDLMKMLEKCIEEF